MIIREQPVKDQVAVCTNCGICYNRCPGKALSQNGTGEVDSRHCLSYLTIEHKGEWDETGRKIIGNMNSEKAIFGCDLCLRSCPLNKKVKRHKPEIFRPKEEIMSLTTEIIREMTAEEFSKIFKGSPLKRAKLSGLKRNIGAN